MYACAELFCVLTNVSNKFVFRRFPLRGALTPSATHCVRPWSHISAGVPFEILERLIYALVGPIIEPLLPREQAHFRLGRSAVDQVTLLT